MLQIDIEPLTELPILIPTDYSIFLSLIDQIITLKKSYKHVFLIIIT